MASPLLFTDPTSKNFQVAGDSAAPVIIKSADLWLLDGNIVLRTIFTPPNSTVPHHTLYKIHKGVLALNSSVFRDLFNGSQVAFDVGSEAYEELPVMDMPDSPDDVAHFLKALYFPEYTQRHHIAPPLKALPDGYSGILRLSTKYDVPSLRETTATAFKLVWPSKLADWDNLQMTIAKDGPFPELNGNVRVDVSNLYEDPAKAIRLAYDCNVLEVLPTAYYDLARIYARNGRFGSKYRRKVDIFIITTAELERLIKGMGEIQHRTNFYAYSLNRLYELCVDISGDCVHGDTTLCKGFLLAQWMEQFSVQDASSGDIVAWLHTVASELETRPDAACASCTDGFRSAVLDIRRDLWNGFPRYFELVNGIGASSDTY